MALVIATVPQVAWSGGSGVVGPAQLSSHAAAELADAMRASGVARPIANAVAEARRAVAAGAVPPLALKRFRLVRDLIEDGWRAYHTVQFDVAANRFAAARDAAQVLLELANGAVLYADATLRLGVVLVRQGRAGEGRAAIALALALDPDRPISPLEFAPEVIAVIDAVRAESQRTQPVAVTTAPSGAALTIDGRDVGRAPITVELAVGQHVVVARLPQHRSRARLLIVDAATNAVPVELDRDDVADRLAAGAAAAMPASQQQHLVDDTLLYADLDDVVLAAETTRRGRSALLAQRCAGAPAKCTAIVEVDYGDRPGLAAAARAIWRDLSAQHLLEPPSLFGDARIVPQPRAAPRCELCRNPYVLAGTGVALVAGAIAIAVVATASRPPPVLTIDPAGFAR